MSSYTPFTVGETLDLRRSDELLKAMAQSKLPKLAGAQHCRKFSATRRMLIAVCWRKE
tara:strand:+ start:100 stop:273 length:174 start_codon:yes stop_codon:yes gene_type:complete